MGATTGLNTFINNCYREGEICREKKQERRKEVEIQRVI
jgi:hypothetical protein